MTAASTEHVLASRLSPAQAVAFAGFERALDFGRIHVVWGAAGYGKTTILHAIREGRLRGARLVSTRDVLAATSSRDPHAMEEAWVEMMHEATSAHDAVLVDDLHLLSDLLLMHHFYPRHGYFEAALKTIVTASVEANKTLVFGCRGKAPDAIADRCYYHGVKSLMAVDYAHVARAVLPGAESLDFEKIHRFAPKLNGHQLRSACEELASEPSLDTARFIEYLRTRRMASNVDLAEVQSVDLRTLRGVDDVIEALEANVVLPFENDALATELRIKPKRGVLLIGPPGTGKTTIGRALAHRLKSKFFLIDGTIISGTRDFYSQIQGIISAAKANAPSIIFIDDSDVIFETGREQGLYRYLLTLLDGLESESAGSVCVMMTAMDVAGLPPALIRSGRVELWLETRLPDLTARAQILEDLHAAVPEVAGRIDVARVAQATEGLTGADLKRLVEDAKVLLAYDKARSRPVRAITDYAIDALSAVHLNRERYAMAEASVRAATRMGPHGHFGPDAFFPGDDEPEPC